MEERERRKGRRVIRRISELMRSFEEGGGIEESGNIVKLDAESNVFDQKTQTDTQL